MKSHFFFTFACCYLALMLSACTKDQHPSQADGTTAPIPNHSDPIEQLRSFRKQLDQVQANPNTKIDETLTLSEALWDIENHFNLTYTDAEQYHSDVCDHEFQLFLPVNERHEVSVQDAVGLYMQAVEQARQTLLSEKSSQRDYLALLVKETEESDGMVRVLFSGKTGERCDYNPTDYPVHVLGPFGADDNWMFATPLGKCDDPDIPSGADEQLQEKLFDTLIGTMEAAAPGCRNVFLDRFCLLFDGSNYPGIYYNNNLEELCIPYYDMNRIFCAEMNLLTWKIPQQYHLDGYCPISVSIQGIHTDDQSAVTHQHEIQYGVRHQVRIDEFGEVESLIQR